MKGMSDILAFFVGVLLVASITTGITNRAEERVYNMEVKTRKDLRIGEIVSIGPCSLVFPACPLRVKLDGSTVHRTGSRGRVTIGDRVICGKDYCHREDGQ